MAMFGHKTQIKRRSQIRREQGVQSLTENPDIIGETVFASQPSAIPRSRSSSIPRAPR